MESRLKSKNRRLRVAIVHDVLIEYGGAERVLEEFLSIFPKADLYTLYFNKKDPVIYKTFNRFQPRTSFLQSIPGLPRLRQYFSVTKLVSWLYFYLLNLSSYDLVISSSHSFNSKIVRKGRDAYHLCYLHSPPRYLYKEINEIAWIKKFPFNFFLFPLFAFLRFTDKRAAEHPDVVVAVSQEIKKRVARYYDREAIIVNPPVRLPKKIKTKREKGNYYLFLSRLVRQKGLELATKTCTKHKLPLLVGGEGYLRKRFENMAGPSVTFSGRLSHGEIPKVYARAWALIYCAVDEDFGLVPVEAMAHGVPVIAFKSGGVKETVVDGKTGIFFENYTPASLFRAIQKFERLSLDPKACRAQAEKFSQEKFKQKIFECLKEGKLKTVDK